MDPDAALERLRELIKQIHSAESGDMFDLADEMATVFEGLDNWLTNRGAKPKDWRWLPLVPPDPDFEDPEPIV